MIITYLYMRPLPCKNSTLSMVCMAICNIVFRLNVRLCISNSFAKLGPNSSNTNALYLDTVPQQQIFGNPVALFPMILNMAQRCLLLIKSDYIEPNNPKLIKNLTYSKYIPYKTCTPRTTLAFQHYYSPISQPIVLR